MSTPIRSIRLDEHRWEALKRFGTDWLKKQIDRAIAKEQRKTTSTPTEE